MHKPRSKFFLSASAVLVGIGCGVTALQWPDNPKQVAAPIALGCASLLGVIFGGLSLQWSTAAYMAEQSLRQGKDVLGRWHVSSAFWQQFVVLNKTFSTNQVTVPDSIEPQGIEVIFSPRAFLCGDHVELLNQTALLKGKVVHWGGDWTIVKASLGGENPCCLYLYGRIQGPGGPPSFNNFIVPVPAHAVAEATRVRDHFLSAIHLAG